MNVNFDPRTQMTIHADGDKFVITCPIWANDLVRNLPDRRWSKAKKAWVASSLKQSLAAIETLSKQAGVHTTRAAQELIKSASAETVLKNKSYAFPAWYRHKVPPLAHQLEGQARLYSVKAAGIFWPMQTGKTKLTIDLSVGHIMENHCDAHMLVLTKFTLRNNWIEQLEKHCPIPWLTHKLNTEHPERLGRFLLKDGLKIALVGWESLSQGGMPDLCRRFLDGAKRSIVVGDELTYIANSKSTRTEFADEFAQCGAFVYGLAGHPALEGVTNLFSMFHFLDPNIIGISDFLAYRNRYVIMGGYEREVRPGVKVATQVIGYQNQDELMRLIAPYSLSKKKEDILDLPPKRPEVRTLELPKELRSIYDKVKKEGVLDMGGKAPDLVLQNVLEVMLRLHQVVGGHGVKGWEKRWIGRDKDGKQVARVKTVYDPVTLIDPKKNPKMKAVCECVEEWRGKMQGLLWAVYQPEIQELVALIKKMGLRVAELHGKVPEPQRQPMIKEFERGGFDIIIGNAATGGMGYTMMAAEMNMFFNNTDRCIDRVQAEDRNWGIGQVKSPIVVDFVYERTVDMTILRSNRDKMDLDAYVKYRIDEVAKLLDGE